MSNSAPSVTPERILKFVWAFAPPLTIEAAIHHRVFDILEKQPLALAELAQAPPLADCRRSPIFWSGSRC
jgi:hypothetical protein